MKLTGLIFVCVLSLLIAAPVTAQVTSKPCPYDCKAAGLKKKICKDWKEGNTCYVEDLRKQKEKVASNNVTKGVTSKPCPHTCKSVGLGKKKCKDWKEGNTCFVEVL